MLRVAVVIAGSLNRLFLESTIRHLFAPLARQSQSVDVFASLSLVEAEPTRAAPSGYQRVLDPMFVSGANGAATPMPEQIASVIQSAVLTGGNGVWLRHLNLTTTAIDLDSDQRLQARRKAALMKWPEEPPDLRFPMFNMTSDLASNTRANQNWLRTHSALNDLWQSVLAAEIEDGNEYSKVILVRDDTFWLQDFQLSALTTANPQSEPDLYLLSCDARRPPMHQTEVCDHAVVANRQAAGFFGGYFDWLLQPQNDPQECYTALHTREGAFAGLGGTNLNANFGCNTEMLLRWGLFKHGLTPRYVGQALIPHQRSARMRAPHGTMVICFHKLCQSHVDPLVLPDEYKATQRCSHLQAPASATPNIMSQSMFSAAEGHAKLTHPSLFALYASYFGDYRNEGEGLREHLKTFNVIGIHAFLFTDSTTIGEIEGWTVVNYSLPSGQALHVMEVMDPHANLATFRIFAHDLATPAYAVKRFCLYHNFKDTETCVQEIMHVLTPELKQIQARAGHNGIPQSRIMAKRLKFKGREHPLLRPYRYLIHVDTAASKFRIVQSALTNGLLEYVQSHPSKSWFGLPHFLVNPPPHRTTIEQEIMVIAQKPDLQRSDKLMAWYHHLAPNIKELNSVPLPATSLFVVDMRRTQFLSHYASIYDTLLKWGLWRDQTVFGYAMLPVANELALFDPFAPNLTHTSDSLTRACRTLSLPGCRAV